jgi:RNA polymerase sigma-70 factor (ECF subfamily)
MSDHTSKSRAELAAQPSGKKLGERPASGAQPQPSDDAELVKRLRSGDETAFEWLIERYQGPLLRLAQVFVPSRAVAEEVVQETWLAVITGLPAFEGRSSLKTWIFRILTNRAKSRGVRERRTVPFSSLADDEGESAPAVDPSRFRPNGRWAEAPRVWDDDTPEKLLATAEAMQRLQSAIAELPPKQRAVVTLRDIQGLEAEEICNILEISETNQRVLLHRARSKLRSVLEDYVDRR